MAMPMDRAVASVLLMKQPQLSYWASQCLYQSKF